LPGTKQLNPEVLKVEVSSSQLRDLSTNLLGIFTLQDIYIKVNNENLLELWVEGDDVAHEFKEPFDFELKPERGYFYFNVHDVLDLEIPGGISGIPVNFCVIHTPIKANFWHFSIRVFSEGVEVSQLDISKTRKTKIWKGVKDFLIGKAFVGSNDYKILPEICYNK